MVSERNSPGQKRGAQEDRSRRIVAWTAEGAKDRGDEPGDTATWEDQVWWGYFDQCGDDEVHPPRAMFRTEEEALAFAALVGQQHDWHVGPCVLSIATRDNVEVPE